MSFSLAGFSGRFTPRTEPRAFLAGVERRVEAGFLMGRPHFRSRYAVVMHTGDELAIRSQDFWTDFNVGLNDITLRVAGDGAIEYEVKFWRWVRGCVVLCGVIGAIILLTFLFPIPGSTLDFRAQWRFGAPQEPWLRNALLWGQLIWWGVAWPWVLALAHRGPAEKFLRRILGEVDAAGGSPAAVAPVTKPPAAA
jgi:hypothetical protein